MWPDKGLGLYEKDMTTLSGTNNFYGSIAKVD